MARIDGIRASFGGRWPQAWQLYPALEARGFMAAQSRLVDGGGRCGVGGVLVRILSRAEAAAQAKVAGKRFVHRVLATCDCGTEVPFGRLAQHRKACTANVFSDQHLAAQQGGR